MDPGVLRFFVREVNRQVQFGLKAADDLSRAVTSHDTNGVWYSIQSLLVATANVSKLLWPNKSASSARGNALRTTLQVEIDSPLASRKFRNHFEHFDERIEELAIAPQTQMVVDSNIGSLEAIKGSVSSAYRNYDPSTETLSFYGEEYELQPVIKSLEILRSVTDQLIKSNQPFEPGAAPDNGGK